MFFLISQRPFAVLNQAEQILWNVLEKEASVGALQARLGALAEEGIRRLLALEVAEMVLPAPPGKRRRVMVIEPHMDDAALSVGGLMLQRRADCEFLIVTMATQSVATSYRALDREFFDIKTVSGIRKAESEIVARLLWGRHIPLGLVEATLRYHLRIGRSTGSGGTYMQSTCIWSILPGGTSWSSGLRPWQRQSLICSRRRSGCPWASACTWTIS